MMGDERVWWGGGGGGCVSSPGSMVVSAAEEGGDALCLAQVHSRMLHLRLVAQVSRLQLQQVGPSQGPSGATASCSQPRRP